MGGPGHKKIEASDDILFQNVIFSFEIHLNLANNLAGNFWYDQINVKKKCKHD